MNVESMPSLPRRETRERTQEFEPKKIKKWTPDEDAAMLELVKQYGTRHVRSVLYFSLDSHCNLSPQ